MQKNEERKVELNSAMEKRGDELDNAAYQYFLTLLQVEGQEAEKIFPWDVSILRELLGDAIALLGRKQLSICNPCVVTEQGREYLCTLSECGCSECKCQSEFMEQERILARITEAMRINGLEVTDSSEDSICIREMKTHENYRINISPVTDKEKDV